MIVFSALFALALGNPGNTCPGNNGNPFNAGPQEHWGFPHHFYYHPYRDGPGYWQCDPVKGCHIIPGPSPLKSGPGYHPNWFGGPGAYPWNGMYMPGFEHPAYHWPPPPQ
ncbi:unnamed protein product [Rhizoctonia solani]|uniref:Uncharacterized protein n=1 Tax=Rhizoctonia solani TaxID=456999 RepID=A0A8H3DQF9_9AGAM|nr:unnamed protein product [Rhizoctonia solani]